MSTNKRYRQGWGERNCPVKEELRTVSYVHGWNKACTHPAQLLPYPKGYHGFKYGANGSIYTTDRVDQVVKRPKKAVLTQEQKLERARLASERRKQRTGGKRARKKDQ